MLVNNWGGPPRTRAVDLTDELVEEAAELLLLSVVRLTRLCLPYLGKSGRGRVINVTSSTVKEPVDNLALSNTLRPGVVGWAKSLSREVGAQGITVNSIAPGPDRHRAASARSTRTARPKPTSPRSRCGRLGSPREVGDVVCFLASDRAALRYGNVIQVDGGLIRSLL